MTSVVGQLSAPWRKRPWVADALMVAGLLLATVVWALVWLDDDPRPFGERPLDVWFWLLVAAQTLPVMLRRDRAFVAMSVAGGASFIGFLADYPEPPANLALIIIIYSAAAYADRRESLTTLAVTAVVILVIALMANSEMNGVVITLTNSVIFGTAWLLGDNIRSRRALQAELVERARRAEAERDSRAASAVAEERARIARDLHDVIAHGVSVMVIQAGAARRVLGDENPTVATSLADIEDTGRTSLDELRRTLAVLRSDDGPGRHPQPGLDDLDDLTASCRDAGLELDFEMQAPEAVSAGVGLTAYRVVQEALTNTLKHAGPAAARVSVAPVGDDLVVEVVDDGRGAAADQPLDGAGFGLAAMAERVALFGGEVRHGPRVGGGYGVHARIPLGGSER